METFWFFRPRFRRAYDSAYDSDFRFSLGQKLSYDSDYDSDSVASENQPFSSFVRSGSTWFKCSCLSGMLLIVLLAVYSTVERITKTSFLRARFTRQISCSLLSAWISYRWDSARYLIEDKWGNRQSVDHTVKINQPEGIPAPAMSKRVVNESLAGTLAVHRLSPPSFFSQRILEW